MIEIIVGEKIINKIRETGIILAFDDRYIYVRYPNREGKIPRDSFEKGVIKYENAELQSKVNQTIARAKEEKEQEIAAQRAEANKSVEDQRRIQEQLSRTHFRVCVDSASIRLDPAPITLGSIRRRDVDLIRDIFAECDKDTQKLYDLFEPQMRYMRDAHRAISKYAVGFVNKYLDTYVLRVFSRNDIYSKNPYAGITISHSDTTEVFRVLRVNGKDYHFSKNIAQQNNSMSFKNWHASEVGKNILLNKVYKLCDCGYLNDYVQVENTEYYGYMNLLIPAFYNNKVEIAFKNRAFSSAYRIHNIVGYLEEFSSKQIVFASENNALNTLPIIKKYGLFDTDVVVKLETLMRKRGDGSCVYDTLGQILQGLALDCSDLDKRLISFLRRVGYFNASLYNDYICELKERGGMTVNDFFDSDYMERHRVMMLEKNVHCSQQEKDDYMRVARELSWISREDNGYFIIVPKYIEDFFEEGSRQHNCVYVSRYYSDVIHRLSIIVFLRKQIDVSYVTIEFDYETFDVLQAYGRFNSKLDDDLYQYIVALGERLRQERLSQE